MLLRIWHWLAILAFQAQGHVWQGPGGSQRLEALHLGGIARWGVAGRVTHGSRPASQCYLHPTLRAVEALS
jgi:hypothetical protein